MAMESTADREIHRTFSSQLTTKQASVLKQYRVNVADILRPEFDDDYLCRWLRARDWDLKKAEKMLRDSLEWRRTYETDTMMEWNPPEVLQKYCRGSVFGCDKEGYPVYMELVGKADFKGVLFSATKKDILRYRTYLIEEIIVKHFPICSKKYGKKIDQCSLLIDMDGVGYKHLWKPLVDLVLEWLPIIESNYPEILRYCYIVNAPSIFPVLYKLAKPFIHDYTREKIRILEGNWKHALLKEFDADQLPIEFGGNRSEPVDGPPFLPLPLGGTVPESYYLKSVTENIDMSQFTTVSVSPGQTLDIDVDIDKPDSILRWNFWTDAKDVAFGVFERLTGRRKTEDMEPVVASSRVNSHMVPEAGSFQCPKTGTYVVRFDNTYSWINAKKLSYHIEVLQPDRSTQELCVKDTFSTDL